MSVVSKVTEVLFDQIKASLEYADPTTVAIANHLSVKTILQIKGSADYADYEAQKKAQHPVSTKKTLAERLDTIEDTLNTILLLAKENRLV